MPKEFRVYYDVADGTIKFYTSADEPGDYITITKEQYAAGRYDLRVKNGKLVDETKHRFGKLVPSDDEGVLCVSDDISIIATTGGQRWKNKNYEND